MEPIIETTTTTTWELQFQINDPGYKYAGQWFDQGINRYSEALGKKLLARYREDFSDWADAYRLQKRTVTKTVEETILPD